MTKKKIAILVCAVILSAAVIIGGTLAYLTDNSLATNTFTVGNVDIDLTEDGIPDPDNPGQIIPGTDWDEDDGDGQDMLPGDTYIKYPIIKALEGDSYMRVKMQILDENGSVITDQNRLALIFEAIRYAQPVLPEGTSYAAADIASYPTVNPAFVLDAARGSNGVYFYNYVEGDGIFSSSVPESVVLFTNIVIPTDFSNDDIALLGNFKIELTAQAIQSDNVTDVAAGYDLLDDEFETP